jgi:hypothetical protein
MAIAVRADRSAVAVAFASRRPAFGPRRQRVGFPRAPKRSERVLQCAPQSQSGPTLPAFTYRWLEPRHRMCRVVRPSSCRIHTTTTSETFERRIRRRWLSARLTMPRMRPFAGQIRSRGDRREGRTLAPRPPGVNSATSGRHAGRCDAAPRSYPRSRYLSRSQACTAASYASRSTRAALR